MTQTLETTDIFDIGDKVRHPKFGDGKVLLRTGDGDNLKLLVKFGGETGEKKLMVKYAKLKKIVERSTLEEGEPGAETPAPEAAAQ